jgi:hypothetical protein|tara:strand:+ start:10927 stop:11520 length:594 start_codon:yes stop_codon:yes gene_type:complete
MAKTNLIVGSVVSPTYLNLINGTNADNGHVHDGTDADGRAPKVSLNNHTNDTLLGTRYTVIQASTVEFSFNNGVSYTESRSMDFCKTGSLVTMRLSGGQIALNGTMSDQFRVKLRIQGGADWPIAIFGDNNPIRSSLSTVSVLPPTNATGCYATLDNLSNDMEIIKGNGDPFLSGDQLFFGDAVSFIFVIVNADLDL